jgi:hypothetical protein
MERDKQGGNLILEPEGKRILGKPRPRYENDIEINPKEVMREVLMIVS